MMEVSVVIPTYNAVATLEVVLTALTRQDYPDFEVIVVDDASTDDTAEIASRFSDRLNLKLHRLASNAGRAHARNCGVREATGEIILLLDADIEVVSGYVAAHRKLHDSTVNSVAIGALKFTPSLARRALGRYYSSRGAVRLDPGQSLPGKYFISGLASFRRSLFDEVGGFDETFRHYGEDQELGLRFYKAGAPLHYLPDAIGYHHHLRSFGDIVANLERYGAEGVPLVLQKHPEFARDLGLDDLTDSRSGNWFKRAVRQLAINPLFYVPLAVIAKTFESIPLPSPLLTYLIYGSYRRGFIRSRRLTR